MDGWMDGWMVSAISVVVESSSSFSDEIDVGEI